MAASPEWYELRTFVMLKKFEEAEALLARKPTLISEVNGIGETVLHYVAVENDEQGVSWLWKRGFDINTKNTFGTPVVFEVANLDCRELLQWFISNGADVKCRNTDGMTIKEYVLDFGHVDIAKHIESLGI